MNGQAPRFRASLAHLHLNFIFVCITLIASLPTVPHAQDLDDVSFSGVVADERGAVIRDARVTARFTNTGAVRATATDEDGRYRLVELQPGAYTLRAESAGFAAEERREVFTLAGQSVRLDFTLRPAALAAEQTVVSDRDSPLIDTTRTVAGGSVTREELERLPLFSRSPLDYVFLLGGVTEEPLSARDAAEDRDDSGHARRAAEAPEEAGAFALAGGPAYSNNVTIDGLDDNDDRAARELWRWVRRLEADASLHTDSRMKGTGAFNLTESAGGTREFIIKGSGPPEQVQRIPRAVPRRPPPPALKCGTSGGGGRDSGVPPTSQVRR